MHVLVIIGIVAFCLMVGGDLLIALNEINPDPRWRRRQAEIRRLEDERLLDRLRKDR